MAQVFVNQAFVGAVGSVVYQGSSARAQKRPPPRLTVTRSPCARGSTPSPSSRRTGPFNCCDSPAACPYSAEPRGSGVLGRVSLVVARPSLVRPADDLSQSRRRPRLVRRRICSSRRRPRLVRRRICLSRLGSEGSSAGKRRGNSLSRQPSARSPATLLDRNEELVVDGGALAAPEVRDLNGDQDLANALAGGRSSERRADGDVRDGTVVREGDRGLTGAPQLGAPALCDVRAPVALSAAFLPPCR